MPCAPNFRTATKTTLRTTVLAAVKKLLTEYASISPNPRANCINKPEKMFKTTPINK